MRSLLTSNLGLFGVSSAGDPAKLLGDAVTAERDRVTAAQGAQLGLGLDDQARKAAEAAPDYQDEELEDRLGLPDAGEILELQRELDCDVYRAVREHQRRTGKGGRKPGALNRRNTEFRKLILASGGHPGLFLQRVYDRPTELLAAELGCSKKEALDKQIRCAVELQPYIEGKMPTNVNLNVRGDFQLVAGGGTGLFDDIAEGEFDELPALGFSEQKQGDGECEE